MKLRKIKTKSFLPAGLLASSLWLLSSAAGLQAEESTRINLQDVDVRTLIDIVAKNTGKNFIVDPAVRGKVTFVSGRGLDKDGLYEAFLSILQVQGLDAVESGNLIKIVPVGKARSQVAPVVSDAAESNVDETVTEVVKLNYISAATAMQTLIPLSGQGETRIQPNQGSNSIVITGRAQNVQRLRDVVESIDQPNNDDFELINLQYAIASQVAQTLQGIALTGGAEGVATGGGKISADERTNSVLISGDKATRERMKKAIAKLDIPKATEGDTRVIPLRYAKAEDIVQVLQGVSPAIQAQAESKGDVAPAGAGAKAPAAAPVATTNTVSSANLGGVTILADKANNAVIISGPPVIQKNLLAVIRQLDRRRAQVMVEAIIAEVSSELSNQLGLGLVGNGVSNGKNGLAGFSNFGGLNTALGLASGTATSIPNGLLLGGGNDNFAAIMEALRGDSATNILSTPTLVTMDNEEAEIVVGQEVPFVTGSYTTAGNTSTNPFTTIERKDVGLTFKITPQINRSNTVNLKIEQEISGVASTSVAGASDLITNKRQLNTNVMVEDGQVLILGGLIEDNYRDTVNKVPVLGDLPVVGAAFRSNDTTKSKKNLMIFIHPLILPDGLAADAYTRKKYQTLQKQQNSARILQRGNLSENAAAFKDLDQISGKNLAAPSSVDDLHSLRRPQAARPTRTPTGHKGKCNTSDPFCSGAL